jgi:tRNA A-37 threonylcarbamoyl transferase component Bud32
MTANDVGLLWRKLELSKEQSPTVRNSHSVCSVGTHALYLFGGRSKGGTNNHLYKLSSGENMGNGWERVKLDGQTPGRLPPARKSSSLTFCGDRLWLFGGNKGRELLNDLWSFDMKSKSWHHIQPDHDCPVPSVRDRHCLVSNPKARKLILFGGSDGTHDKNEFMNDLWEYDIAKNKWREIKAKPIPPRRYEHYMVAMNGQVFIFTGKCRKGGMEDLWVADLNRLDHWKEMSTRCTGDIGKRWGATAISNSNQLLIFGGWDGRMCFADVVMVDLERRKITTIKLPGQAPPARVFHGSGMLRSRMVIVAGRDIAKRLQDTWYLDLSSLNEEKVQTASQEKRKETLRRNKPSELNLMLTREKRKATTEDLEMYATIGTGSFGRVRLCKARATNEYFAIKIMRKTKVIKTRQENHIRWEKKILSSIRHPFIVNLEAAFQDRYHLYLTLELVQGGEFFNLLRKTNILKVPHARFFAAQIVLVFQFLHNYNIVYRDLKPENCLINVDGYLKITDFGFAKRLTRKPFKTYTLCGTPEYIAPEILRNQGHSFGVDWWALGILLYEILEGEPPFVDNNPMLIYQKIMKGVIKKWPSKIDPTVKDFIVKLLVGNPDKRIGSAPAGTRNVMLHGFFKRVNWRQLLEKKVQAPYLPEVRGPSDTRHFENFSDDSEEEDVTFSEKNDPFKDQW